jgi:HK97 family phage prohead protease
MDTKSFSFKADLDDDDDDRGIFAGMASVFDFEDHQGEVVVAGAFDETLKIHEGIFPILWQHDYNRPIGKALLQETATGLEVERGELDLDIADGQRTYSGLKKGYLTAMSIGFNTVEDEWIDGVRHLKKIDLWEISIVTFPVNRLALVDSVKQQPWPGGSAIDALTAKWRGEREALEVRQGEQDERLQSFLDAPSLETQMLAAKALGRARRELNIGWPVKLVWKANLRCSGEFRRDCPDKIWIESTQPVGELVKAVLHECHHLHGRFVANTMAERLSMDSPAEVWRQEEAAELYARKTWERLRQEENLPWSPPAPACTPPAAEAPEARPSAAYRVAVGRYRMLSLRF